ncbi:DUF362 domain-containing protein [Thermodesulfobacteriota bacterium]
MMRSPVYFMDLRATLKENLLAKLARLLTTAGIENAVRARDLVAVKLHFGESGNAAFIRPVYLRRIVEVLRDLKAIPFLTDANTLYKGTRSDSPTHLTTAIQNGFAFSVVGAPVIIADGLRGRTETVVPIDQKHFKEAYVGTEIVEADALLSVAHFKFHELSGFGGALKNLGMGCASRRGKLAQHSFLSPKVNAKKCGGCGECEDRCSQEAISVLNEKAVIDDEKCIGCGECILSCQQNAVQIRWNTEVPSFLECLVEYSYAVLKDKENRCFFVNFVTNVSPACDCQPFNDAPVVRDIGILASNDPVAIDQASADLVNNEPGIPSSCLKASLEPGQDKIRDVYPYVEWTIQLDYAQQLGMGSRDYELIQV